MPTTNINVTVASTATANEVANVLHQLRQVASSITVKVDLRGSGAASGE